MKKIIEIIGISLILVSCQHEHNKSTVTLYANDGAIIKVYYKADIRGMGSFITFIDSCGKTVMVSGIYTVE